VLFHHQKSCCIFQKWQAELLAVMRITASIIFGDPLCRKPVRQPKKYYDPDSKKKGDKHDPKHGFKEVFVRHYNGVKKEQSGHMAGWGFRCRQATVPALCQDNEIIVNRLTCNQRHRDIT
jgi:hypothetical protein